VEVFVGALRAFELPGEFGHMGAEVVGGLGFAQQEQGRSGDAALDGELGLGQKLCIAPASDGGFGYASALTAGEDVTGFSQRGRIQIVHRGMWAHDRRPVL
jgi:hypothetical protein